MSASNDQCRHDAINLGRLVKRLETLVSNDDWTCISSSSKEHTKWLKSQSALEGIRYSRTLLENVQSHDDNPGATQKETSRMLRYEEVTATLDRLEAEMLKVSRALKPRRRPLRPILPTLPPPSLHQVSNVEAAPPIVNAASAHPPEATLLPAEDEAPFTHELLFDYSLATCSTHPSSNPATILLTPSLPTSTEGSSSKAPPAFLQASTALQTDLSEQLARMAKQLKDNALHFADALEKDQALVQEAAEKLEDNFGAMQKQRLRLRDHRGKSWGTTGLTIMTLVTVMVAFFAMFFVIRLT